VGQISSDFDPSLMTEPRADHMFENVKVVLRILTWFKLAIDRGFDAFEMLNHEPSSSLRG
jgi:hypothetical protein